MYGKNGKKYPKNIQKKIQKKNPKNYPKKYPDFFFRIFLDGGSMSFLVFFLDYPA